jgi:hypothetical protein
MAADHPFDAHVLDTKRKQHLTAAKAAGVGSRETIEGEGWMSGSEWTLRTALEGTSQRDEQDAKVYVEVAEVHRSLKRYAIAGKCIGLDSIVKTVEDLTDEQFEHPLEEKNGRKKTGIHNTFGGRSSQFYWLFRRRFEFSATASSDFWIKAICPNKKKNNFELWWKQFCEHFPLGHLRSVSECLSWSSRDVLADSKIDELLGGIPLIGYESKVECCPSGFALRGDPTNLIAPALPLAFGSLALGSLHPDSDPHRRYAWSQDGQSLVRAPGSGVSFSHLFTGWPFQRVPNIIFHISQMPFSHFYPLLKWKNCVCGSWDRAENNIHHIPKVLFVNLRDIK